MNKVQKRRQTLNKLHRAFNTKQNVVKINKVNTLEHELAKFLLAWEARQNDVDFVTEAIFRNGKRADVLLLQTGEALEIVHSEGEKSILLKREDYPVPIVVFEAGDVIRFWTKKLQDLLGGQE